MATRLGGKALTKELIKLASVVHVTLHDGTEVTREQALAELLWKMALGYTEPYVDDAGNPKEMVHKPTQWAMTLVFERLEGKAPSAMPDDTGGVTAAQKIRALAKDRLNAMAIKAAKSPKSSPPTYTPKPTK